MLNKEKCIIYGGGGFIGSHLAETLLDYGYDVTVFDGGVLPSFLPHLTLDYDFDGDAYTLASLQNEKIEAYFDIAHLSVMKISDAMITFL